VDGGEIDLGEAGDFPDGGGCEALAGKNFARRGQQSLPGLVLATVAGHPSAFMELQDSDQSYGEMVVWSIHTAVGREQQLCVCIIFI